MRLTSSSRYLLHLATCAAVDGFVFGQRPFRHEWRAGKQSDLLQLASKVCVGNIKLSRI